MEASWNPDGSVLLSWQPLSLTEAKGFPLYIVSYKSVDGSFRGSVNTTNSSVVISGLNSKGSYIITVQVTTENGKNKGDTENSKGCMDFVMYYHLYIRIYRPAVISLHTISASVCFILYPYLALLNAPRPANENSAVIVGVLFGGAAMGVLAVMLVLGIVCGVCKLRKWKKQPSSTETDPTAENKSVTHYKCMMHIWSIKLYNYIY